MKVTGEREGERERERERERGRERNGYILNNCWIYYSKLICHLPIYLAISAKDNVKQQRTFRELLFLMM